MNRSSMPISEVIFILEKKVHELNKKRNKLYLEIERKVYSSFIDNIPDYVEIESIKRAEHEIIGIILQCKGLTEEEIKKDFNISREYNEIDCKRQDGKFE